MAGRRIGLGQPCVHVRSGRNGFRRRDRPVSCGCELTSPHGPRAVSLQERQMDLLRERLKGFEHKIMEMIRHGQENAAIADRLHRYTRSLLITTDAAALPDVLVRELMHQFLIPQAGIRVWGAAAEHAALPFAREVSADARSFASSLSLPYCGANAGFEAATWLDDPSTIASLALIPLRHGSSTDAFGLLVLGSPDPTRFAADMGTEFLMRIGEISSAGLSRLTRAA
ncbi:MAG: hypothetical protein B7Y51_08045 [Burkholderiales bacterium 28-67-8]|nr:MAG: hypothetical protein B7Y51_08045 [Burkholderiales bacterium 28-67-8]